MVDGPHALLALQDLDTRIDQLRHRLAHLPDRARLAEVTAAARAAESDGADLTTRRHALLARQAELEAELAGIEDRRTSLDGQMRSGSVTAPRDLQAMVDQLAALKRRQSDLEDAELEVMEEVEPLDARLVAVQDLWVDLEARRDALTAAVAEAEVAVDADLQVALDARAEAARAVPGELAALYGRLRDRLGGVGVAHLTGSSCGGCHLALSASELDRIRRQPPDAVVMCEQCGRILVR